MTPFDPQDPQQTLKVITSRPEGSCPWCAIPLGEDSKYFGACRSHRQCTHCQKTLHPSEISYCETYDIPPSHARCLPSAIRPSAVETEYVEITQKDLDHLNLCRLLLTPNLEWNPETNAQEAEFKTHSFVHEMSLDEKFIFLRRMEGILAAASVLIKKDRKTAEANAAKRSNEQFEKAKQDIKKNAIKAPKTQGKALSTAEKQREKGILALMAAGMDRQTAEGIIASAPQPQRAN